MFVPAPGIVPAPWNQLHHRKGRRTHFRIVPAPWNQPFAERFSESFGHII